MDWRKTTVQTTFLPCRQYRARRPAAETAVNLRFYHAMSRKRAAHLVANNESLLNDPLYLGVRQPRVRGEDYDAMIEDFVVAVQDVFPKCCIQFEDFANIHSVPILAHYRDRVCCFNDDIQGTAAVAVAGIFGALRTLKNRIVDQTFLILGAGSAGTGIANLLTKTMMQEGVPEAVARARCWLFDSKGVVVSSRAELAAFKKPYAHNHAPVTDFLGAIEAIRPTAIIGVSAIAKAFNQQVIQAMARVNERPIIFPYSNPRLRTRSNPSREIKRGNIAWSLDNQTFM